MRSERRKVPSPRTFGTALTLSTLVAARGVAACPFCASGATGTGPSYLIATIFMLVIPLGLIGGFALWVRRSVRPDDAGEGTDGPVPGDASPRTGRRDG